LRDRARGLGRNSGYRRLPRRPQGRQNFHRIEVGRWHITQG
jgi:hypothetical protein